MDSKAIKTMRLVLIQKYLSSLQRLGVEVQVEISEFLQR